MSCFDDDQPKKEKTPKEPNNFEKTRSSRRKQKTKIPAQEKPKRVYPPLMIRARPNEDQEEQLLQDYVREMYALRKSQEGESKFIQNFLEEDDEGPVQYKLKLVNPTDDRLDHLATQMKFRVREGLGEAHYRIGVEDNGRPYGLEQEEMLESLRTICLLAGRLGLDVMVFRVTEGLKGLVMELIIRQRHRQGVKLEIRILLLGESGSGKSTLLGVLKSGEKDNGKGSARGKVHTHKHEIMSGTTQSRSHHVIGFDAEGRLYNQKTMMSLQKWLDDSNKILTFIDVGGHRKAEKQLVSSLCSFFPEYAVWVVSGLCKTPSNANTLELANIFGLPLIVVITHLDQMNKDQEMEAVLKIKEQLKKFCPDKTPCLVKEMEHAVLFSRITQSQDVLPIFLISNMTGKNLDLLSSFLNLLTAASELKNNEQLNTEFSISDKYVVEGKIILAGTVIKGSIKRGQLLHIGPDMKGTFRAVEIVSIECLRVPVKLAKCGQVCTLAIRPLNYAREWLEKQPNAIRRGMVLVDSKSNPKAVYEFLVELTPYSSDRQEFSIFQKYLPVINTLTTRQICQIVVIKPQEEEFTIPDLLSKKKSRSIDARKLDHQSYRSSENKFKKPSRMAPKKSVDLTMQSCEQIPKALETITEYPLLKKGKEISEIHFKSGKLTHLRLRFKYYPEYITIGQRVIINELKLIGRVREIFY